MFSFSSNPSAPDADEIAEAQARATERLQTARENRDVVLDMPMQDVHEAWGEPRDIETAGEAAAGNQRWTYLDGISKLGRVRMVYFERGKVVGWDTFER